MRLLAWNLAHKARERPIHPRTMEVVDRLAPDLLVLTEYVHGASRDPFVAALAELGLRHVEVSALIGRNNQVLTASRVPLVRGNLAGPATDDHAGATNFLHVSLPDTGLELVGLRAPAYQTRRELRDYWARLESILAPLVDRRLVVVGDLNADPTDSRYCATPFLERLQAAGWRIPPPEGAWSFESLRGRRSRIDHALVAPSMTCVGARYVVEIDGVPTAGNATGAVSDHAPLVIDLST